MAEHRLYPVGTVPPVSTFEFHEHRERAPHLEQPVHRPRLDKALEFITGAMARDRYVGTLTDLGCGDGGLLALVDASPLDLFTWGYDFQPSNAAGWAERGVRAQALDVFGEDWPRVAVGRIVVCTEVLEHLAEPHQALRRISDDHSPEFIVASSPWTETPESHDACHAWAWDMDGYRALIDQAGYQVLQHETVGQFQVILGERQ